MAKRLTVRFVQTVTAPGRYFDSGSGIFLKVAPAGKTKPVGAKTWIQRVTIGGRVVDLGLGSARIVGLKDARQKAEDNRRLIAAGGDPRSERRRAKRTPAFSAVAQQVIEKKKRELKNEKSKAQWASTLETYAFPVIGDLPVDKITTEHVLQIIEPIWATKAETASRLRGRIETVLDAAKAGGHRNGENPARWKGHLDTILPKQSGKKKHHPAVAQSDLVQWWADLCQRDSISADALKFTALTAARTNEVLGLQWSDIDFDKGMITLSAERMKSDKPHTLVLSQEAAAILKRQPRVHGNPHVFTGSKARQGLSNMSMTKVIRGLHAAKVKRDETGYLDSQSDRPAVVHGLRSSLKVWATDSGVDEYVSERILAHEIGSEAQRAYDRSDARERRRVVLDQWHAFLTGERAGQVIKLHG